MNEEKLATFMQAFRSNLAAAITENPHQYRYGLDNLDEVTRGMCNAVRLNGFDKDGRAMKATFKQLGIKHTYKALNEYLRQEDVHHGTTAVNTKA